MEAGRPYVFVQVSGERFARRFVEVAARERVWSACAPASSQASAWSRVAPTKFSSPPPQKDCPQKATFTEADMKRIIQWSIEHSWLVIGLSLLLLGAGAWTARQMPIDVFPDLTAPTVTILTEGHGMAPEEMESLVTFPLESAINGASGVRRVRSATAVGSRWSGSSSTGAPTSSWRVSSSQRSWHSSAATLPPQVERPVLAPVSSIMGEILFFAISSDADDPLTLRTIADTTVRRRLLAVPGVSQVTPIGGSERQFQVIAHPDALRANNVTLTELLTAVRGASQNTSAGVYTEGAQEFVLEAVGRARTPEEIGETVVALRGDRSVLVRNVADVREGGAFKRGEGSRSGKPAVIVGVQKQPGANTIEVTRRLDRELDTLQQRVACRHDDRPADLPSGRLHPGRRRKRLSGASRRRAPRRVIVVLFLANARASAITLTAIPLSLAAAILALRAFGANINTMTLGGMAIAVGDLVDDAIVDVENVVRRLRENRAKPEAERLSAADDRA